MANSDEDARVISQREEGDRKVIQEIKVAQRMSAAINLAKHADSIANNDCARFGDTAIAILAVAIFNELR